MPQKEESAKSKLSAGDQAIAEKYARELADLATNWDYSDVPDLLVEEISDRILRAIAESRQPSEKFAGEKGMPELDSRSRSYRTGKARNLSPRNSLLRKIRDLAKWDGPDAAPKRMHEIWQITSTEIENAEFGAEGRGEP